MKKVDLIDAVAKQGDFTKVDTKRFLDALDVVVLDAIAKEESVPFGFGKIYGVTTAPRVARNPRTGETINIPEKHGQPRYKASSKAKE